MSHEDLTLDAGAQEALKTRRRTGERCSRYDDLATGSNQKSPLVGGVGLGAVAWSVCVILQLTQRCWSSHGSAGAVQLEERAIGELDSFAMCTVVRTGSISSSYLCASSLWPRARLLQACFAGGSDRRTGEPGTLIGRLV